MGQRREQVVCVAVRDRGVPAGGGQQPSHAVVAVSGGDALRVRDGVYKRAVGVVRVGDGVPVTRGDGSRHVAVRGVGRVAADYTAVPAAANTC